LGQIQSGERGNQTQGSEPPPRHSNEGGDQSRQAEANARAHLFVVVIDFLFVLTPPRGDLPLRLLFLCHEFLPQMIRLGLLPPKGAQHRSGVLRGYAVSSFLGRNLPLPRNQL